MPDSFGARLRRQREDRQIDLTLIAAQTKIKLALLEALERDDLSHWPSGIFRRAYIRTYAQLIGLDPDATLTEFMEVHPDPGDAFTETATTLAAAESSKGPPPTRLRTMVDSALGSLAKLRRPATGDDSPPRTARRSEVAPAAVAPPQAQYDPGPVNEHEHEQTALLNDVPGPVAVHDGPPPLTEGMESADEISDGIPAEPDDQTELVSTEVPSASDDSTETPEPRLGDSDTVPPRLEAIARLCTEFGRVVEREEVQALLAESASLLDAAGLIVWVWDDFVEELRPALAHGYSGKMLAYLPMLKRDADNATAAAFRSGETCEVAATAESSGALVLPLLAVDGPLGVLAIELQQGVEPRRLARAFATMVAAALTHLVHRSQAPPRQRQDNPTTELPAQFVPPLRPFKVRR